MNLQERLQTLRKEKKLSQESLAEHIGVSRQAVAKWELGQSYPDLDKLISLSELFKVSIDKLVKDNEDECSLTETANVQKIVREEVVNFLCKAKRICYAGKGTEVKASRLNSHDLEYSEGNFKYMDTYLGGEKFAGEEALWKNDIPFWSMNYAGRILSEGFNIDFLKEALFLVPKEYPYRGPMVYENGDYKYHCIIQGDFSWYQGYEEIFFNSKKVYECFFHGGEIN
jgi:transcriptional regulator with XRE-family HTH domain